MFVYVRNTRVGGNSLFHYVLKNGDIDNLIVNSLHCTFGELLKFIPSVFYRVPDDEVKYIATIREPFEHTVSYWMYDRQITGRTHSLKYYLENNICSICHLKQHLFIKHGNRFVDHIIRYEDGDTFQQVCNIIGHTPTENIRWASNRYDKKWYEYYTPETVDMVRNIFRDDFNILGYSMEFPR